jgi:hypothetical protein
VIYALKQETRRVFYRASVFNCAMQKAVARKIISAARVAAESKFLPVGLAILAILLSLSVLDRRLIIDDLLHRAILIDSNSLPEQMQDDEILPKPAGKLSTALFEMFSSLREGMIGKAKDNGYVCMSSAEMRQICL